MSAGSSNVVLRPADRAEDRLRPGLAPGVEAPPPREDPLHQGDLVLGNMDDESPIDPDRGAVAPDDAGAQSVKGAGLHLRPGSPTSRMIRSRSSPAARFVNVTARICQGRIPLTPTRHAIRWARTLSCLSSLPRESARDRRSSSRRGPAPGSAGRGSRARGSGAPRPGASRPPDGPRDRMRPRDLDPPGRCPRAIPAPPELPSRRSSSASPKAVPPRSPRRHRRAGRVLAGERWDSPSNCIRGRLLPAAGYSPALRGGARRRDGSL